MPNVAGFVLIKLSSTAEKAALNLRYVFFLEHFLSIAKPYIHFEHLASFLVGFPGTRPQETTQFISFPRENLGSKLIPDKCSLF